MFPAQRPSKRSCTGRLTGACSGTVVEIALFILRFTLGPGHRPVHAEPDPLLESYDPEGGQAHTDDP